MTGKNEVKFAVGCDSTVDKLLAVQRTRLLALDTPWPLPDVLAKLIEATEHLLGHHGCDAHGHEEYRAAAESGKAVLKLFSEAREFYSCDLCGENVARGKGHACGPRGSIKQSSSAGESA
jgi:hypothetical protein